MLGVKLYILIALIGICVADNSTEKYGETKARADFLYARTALGHRHTGKRSLNEEYDHLIRRRRDDTNEGGVIDGTGEDGKDEGGEGDGATTQKSAANTTQEKTSTEILTTSAAPRSCRITPILLIINCLVVAYNALQ